MALDDSGLFDRGVAIGDDLDLVISQREIGDEGAVVWDAALVLCAYIRKVSATSKQGMCMAHNSHP